jgi:hypothetical protein
MLPAGLLSVLTHWRNIKGSIIAVHRQHFPALAAARCGSNAKCCDGSLSAVFCGGIPPVNPKPTNERSLMPTQCSTPQRVEF